MSGKACREKGEPVMGGRKAFQGTLRLVAIIALGLYQPYVSDPWDFSRDRWGCSLHPPQRQSPVAKSITVSVFSFGPRGRPSILSAPDPSNHCLLGEAAGQDVLELSNLTDHPTFSLF
jgi:hypothetical protein